MLPVNCAQTAVEASSRKVRREREGKSLNLAAMFTPRGSRPGRVRKRFLIWPLFITPRPITVKNNFRCFCTPEAPVSLRSDYQEALLLLARPAPGRHDSCSLAHSHQLVRRNAFPLLVETVPPINPYLARTSRAQAEVQPSIIRGLI